MLSSVLSSQRAVQMHILIPRASVILRDLIASHKDLAARMEKLELSQDQHASVINLLAEHIENLKPLPPEQSKKRIGFVANSAVEVYETKPGIASFSRQLCQFFAARYPKAQLYKTRPVTLEKRRAP